VAYHPLSMFSSEMASRRHFWPYWPGTSILLVSASHVSWDDRHCYYAQLLVEMGSCELFAQAGLKPLFS
jgi:hypothetical protein